MAQYEAHVSGNYKQIVEFIHKELWQQSTSLSLEEQFSKTVNGKQVEMRVYERYSYLGGNRASLSVLFIETEDGADICGAATGGSNAVFWKINTFGESAFLETLEIAVSAWNQQKP